MWPRWGLVAVQWLRDTQEWGPPRSSERACGWSPGAGGGVWGDGGKDRAQFRCLQQAVPTDLREDQHTHLAL